MTDKQPTTASKGETMKRRSDAYLLGEALRAYAAAWEGWSAEIAAGIGGEAPPFPPLPPLTRWQRFVLALDDAKETMLAGLRQDWRYFVILWLGIVVGGLAGWLEWGM